MNPRPGRGWGPLAVVILAVYLVPLGVTGTAVALPQIARELGSDAAGLQWVVNAFNIAFAVSTIGFGLLADRLGARVTFMIGLAVLIAASILSALAPTLAVLDLARLLAGAGGGGVVAGGSTMLTRLYPPGAARRRAFALFGATVGFGLALGPTICGAIVSGIGWRAVYVTVAMAAGTLLVTCPLLPRAAPLAHPRTRDGNGEAAMRADRRLLAIILAPLAPAAGFITMVSYLPTALAAVYEMDAVSTGFFLLPMTLPVLFGPLVGAMLIARAPRITPVILVACSLVALLIGDLGLLLLSPQIAPAWLIASLVLVGIGYGLPLGVIDAEAVSRAPAHRAGTVAGVLNSVRTGASAIAVAAWGYAMVALLGLDLPAALAAEAAGGASGFAEAYASAFRVLVVAVTLAVAAVLAVFLILVRHPPRGSAGGRRRG